MSSLRRFQPKQQQQQDSSQYESTTNANTLVDKKLLDFSRCYDEIDQIYDYIRGNAPLPSQLRKIKSIDFESIEKHQQQHTQQHKPADRKKTTQSSSSSKNSSTSSKVNNLVKHDSDQPALLGADVNSGTIRSKLSSCQAERTPTSKPTLLGPVKLTTSTSLARRPLVKRVESLNLTGARRPFIETAVRLDSSSPVIAPALEVARPAATTNYSKYHYPSQPLSRAQSSFILNKQFKLPDVDQPDSLRISTHQTSAPNWYFRRRQSDFPWHHLKNIKPTQLASARDNSPLLARGNSHNSSRPVSSKDSSQRKISSASAFPPLPPVPTSIRHIDIDEVENIKPQRTRRRNIDQQRRLTAIGITRTELQQLYKQAEDELKPNSLDDDMFQDQTRTVPYSLNSNSLEVPLIDEEATTPHSSNASLSSLSSSGNNAPAIQKPKQASSPKACVNPYTPAETERSSNESQSEHIYEALDTTHKSSTPIKNRYPNSVSDLQSFSSNSYVSSNSHSRSSENLHRDGYKRMHEARITNNHQKFVPKVPRAQYKQQSAATKSKREQQAKHDSNFWRHQTNKNKTNNPVHTTSSRKSSALSSTSRDKRPESSGSTKSNTNDTEEEIRKMRNKSTVSSYRTSITSPIAAMFVAAASALKRTPTPGREESSYSNKHSDARRLIDKQQTSIPRESKQPVKHYRYPEVRVSRLEACNQQRNAKSRQRSPSHPTNTDSTSARKSSQDARSNSSTSSYEVALKNDVNPPQKPAARSRCHLNGHHNQSEATNSLKTLIKVPKLSSKSHLLKPITPTNSLSYIDK